MNLKFTRLVNDILYLLYYEQIGGARNKQKKAFIQFLKWQRWHDELFGGTNYSEERSVFKFQISFLSFPVGDF